MEGDFVLARALASRAMAATRQEMGTLFQLTGSVALDLHGALGRGVHHDVGRPTPLNVNLTTPQDHDPDRAVSRIAGALEHAGWDAEVIVADVPPSPMSRSLQISSNRLTQPIVLTTTRSPEYTNPQSQDIEGLAVSTLPTLLLRTVQQVQFRRDARDFIDLVAMEDVMGSAAVVSWTRQWLDDQARKSPVLGSAGVYERLHYGLSRVVTVVSREMWHYGLDAQAQEVVKDRVVLLAGRIAQQAPENERRPGNALQQLLSKSGPELATMRVAAEALGVELNDVALRVPSPAAMAARRLEAERQAVLTAAEQRRRKALDAGRAGLGIVPGPGSRPTM